MARAIWKGSLAFGLVNIPVELYPGVRESRPRFRLLHARDKSAVKYERVCAREGKPAAREDLVKGRENTGTIARRQASGRGKTRQAA